MRSYIILIIAVSTLLACKQNNNNESEYFEGVITYSINIQKKDSVDIDPSLLKIYLDGIKKIYGTEIVHYTKSGKVYQSYTTSPMIEYIHLSGYDSIDYMKPKGRNVLMVFGKNRENEEKIISVENIDSTVNICGYKCFGKKFIYKEKTITAWFAEDLQLDKEKYSIYTGGFDLNKIYQSGGVHVLKWIFEREYSSNIWEATKVDNKELEESIFEIPDLERVDGESTLQ